MAELNEVGKGQWEDLTPPLPTSHSPPPTLPSSSTPLLPLLLSPPPPPLPPPLLSSPLSSPPGGGERRRRGVGGGERRSSGPIQTHKRAGLRKQLHVGRREAHRFHCTTSQYLDPLGVILDSTGSGVATPENTRLIFEYPGKIHAES